MCRPRTIPVIALYALTVYTICYHKLYRCRGHEVPCICDVRMELENMKRTQEYPIRDERGHIIGFTPMSMTETCYTVSRGVPGNYGVTRMNDGTWSVIHVTYRDYQNWPRTWEFVDKYMWLDLEHATFRAQLLADNEEQKIYAMEIMQWLYS